MSKKGTGRIKIDGSWEDAMAHAIKLPASAIPPRKVKKRKAAKKKAG